MVIQLNGRVSCKLKLDLSIISSECRRREELSRIWPAVYAEHL